MLTGAITRLSAEQRQPTIKMRDGNQKVHRVDATFPRLSAETGTRSTSFDPGSIGSLNRVSPGTVSARATNAASKSPAESKVMEARPERASHADTIFAYVAFVISLNA
jgi:hypothetical protein